MCMWYVHTKNKTGTYVHTQIHVTCIFNLNSKYRSIVLVKHTCVHTHMFHILHIQITPYTWTSSLAL